MQGVFFNYLFPINFWKTAANINPTNTVMKAYSVENPVKVKPKIKRIGTATTIEVLNPTLIFEENMKKNIVAIIIDRNALPTSSFTKIHLRSNKSHDGNLIYLHF